MILPFDPEKLKGGNIHLPHPIIFENPYRDGVMLNASPNLREPTSAYLFVTPREQRLISPVDGLITSVNTDHNFREENNHNCNYMEIHDEGINIRIEHILTGKKRNK